jgi:phosphocarrier protein HPr
MAQNIHVARRQVGVSNELGLHLRVADKFVKLANSFQSEVWVHCKGIMANGRSILSLLSLAAECGSMLALEAHGCDAEDAVVALANLISPQTHESEAQHREAGVLQPATEADAGPLRESSPTESPGSQRSDRSGKCGPRWDS